MIVDRNEIRRLQKAAKDGNKLALGAWASQFENQIKDELEREFEKSYKQQLAESIDVFCIAIAYTAHFSEAIKLGKKRLPEFMEDLFVTVDMFRRGEYNPKDYKEELEKCGIYFNEYQYSNASKKGIDYEDRCKRAIDYFKTNTDVVEGLKILEGNDKEDDVNGN